MLDSNIVANLRDRYRDIHPLIFQRSLEKSRSAGDLFDILDTIPKEFPFAWDDDEHRWLQILLVDWSQK